MTYRSLTTLILAASAFGAAAQDAAFEQRMDLHIAGDPWLGTVVTPYALDPGEHSYKVYTHVYAPETGEPLTKGAGGKYTHHRGLFIGWKDTLVDGEDYDTWHMPNCYQQHVRWLALDDDAEGGVRQMQEIHWFSEDGEPFIREVRSISARPGGDGLRIIDFASTLESLAGDIELRGDLQHAGMQIRMADEVSEHEDTTVYTLPEGAQENEDDEVVGAWWVMGSFVVDGERSWLVHMTPPDHPTGQPVYSIRQYGRFGAFWETTLREGAPHDVHFRIVVSGDELSPADAAGLYEAYAATR
jgi:hypothetical protein